MNGADHPGHEEKEPAMIIDRIITFFKLRCPNWLTVYSAFMPQIQCFSPSSSCVHTTCWAWTLIFEQRPRILAVERVWRSSASLNTCINQESTL